MALSQESLKTRRGGENKVLGISGKPLLVIIEGRDIDKMVDVEANLKELCARIVPDLDNCTNQDKKDTYTYLDLKVKATPEGADIKGYLDSSLVSSDSCVLTTARTSGCLIQLYYNNYTGKESLAIIPS